MDGIHWFYGEFGLQKNCWQNWAAKGICVELFGPHQTNSEILLPATTLFFRRFWVHQALTSLDTSFEAKPTVTELGPKFLCWVVY